MKTKATKINIGATGILTDPYGRILLGRRVADDSSYPGMWCTPGGGIEIGEHAVDALIREFMEEVELRVMPDQRMQWTRAVDRINEEKHTILLFTKVVMDPPDQTPIAGDGFDKVGWFTDTEITNMSLRMEITPLTLAAITAWQDWMSR